MKELLAKLREGKRRVVVDVEAPRKIAWLYSEGMRMSDSDVVFSEGPNNDDLLAEALDALGWYRNLCVPGPNGPTPFASEAITRITTELEKRLGVKGGVE